MYFLGDFRALAPRHLTPQSETLEWLAQAHTRAEGARATLEGRGFEHGSFLDSMRRRLARFGCDSGTIATRGHEIDDCAHQRWDDMEVYRANERPEGEGMRARTKVFGRVASAALERLFDDARVAPEHLIHVTCTGYEAPSAAQLLVARKGWGRHTSVTHAYHMGCYAALPALRMATGFASVGAAKTTASIVAKRVDVVHTEICSLHLHPLRHDAEQLVIQSLFADGCICYSVHAALEALGGAPGFAVLSEDEWIVPDSASSMAWFCADFGMEMVLARDVPNKIAASLATFVEALLARAGLPYTEVERALFALHPGGPKIVDQIAVTLGLAEAQVAASRAVLRAHGNMSSATLPHVWQAIARDAGVRDGQVVVSLAFGPGLTLSGAVVRKVAAC